MGLLPTPSRGVDVTLQLNAASGDVAEASNNPSSLEASSCNVSNNNNDNTKKDNFPSLLKGRRILLATESLGPVNGVSRTTTSLIEYLRRNGVQVAVVAPKFDETKQLKSAYDVKAEVRLHGYPLPYNPALTVVYPFRLDRVFMRTFKPDIVYLASPASVGFQFLLQIRQLQDPPVVLANFQTDLSAYSEIILPAFLDRFAVWLLGVVQGFLFNHKAVHTVFYPSAGVRSYLEKAGAPSNKLVHLGRGVDTVLFNPSQRDDSYRHEIAPNGEIILVCVCRLAPEKGFKFLADAAIALADKSLPFKLLIVGGNRNPAVEEEVRRYFEPVKENVIFTGFLTGRPLARAYASGDLFLHCSITETFGLVVLEAMASGLPVVARDQGGPSEIIHDGKTGHLVPPHDLDLFVSQVLRISRETNLRSTMVSAALQYAGETTWEKINLSVAGHIAEGLDNQLRTTQQNKSRRPIRNWLLARYHQIKIGTLLPLVVMLRLNAAIGLVFFFWLIAVIPLIVHGNSGFLGNWRSFISIPVLLQQLRYPFIR